MYSVLMFASIINLHCAAISYATISTNRTLQIQESIPTTITHLSPMDNQESSLAYIAEQDLAQQQQYHHNNNNNHLQQHEQEQHSHLYSDQQLHDQQRRPSSNQTNQDNDFINGSHADPTSNYSTIDRSQQDITLREMNSFRLEYNKFRILSKIGIETDPVSLSPLLEEDLRQKMIATTAFSDQNNQSSMRHKRSLTCDQVKSNKDSCCLENFYVNFTSIGWDKWILYPAGYHANYCRGQCDLSHARYYHSTLLSKYSNIISLCCSPKQMAPLRLLYIDEENKVHQKSIPDMIVESCDCA